MQWSLEQNMDKVHTNATTINCLIGDFNRLENKVDKLSDVLTNISSSVSVLLAKKMEAEKMKFKKFKLKLRSRGAQDLNPRRWCPSRSK